MSSEGERFRRAHPALASVAGLRRFPVKSMLGEGVSDLDLEERGCVGDRRWAVLTATNKIGSGKNTRRFSAVPGLLELRAQHRGGGVVLVFPDGSTCPVDDADAARRVSSHLGREVTLCEETVVSHFDEAPVSIVTRASIQVVSDAVDAVVDADRFRANIILDGTPSPFVEEGWVGRRLRLGDALLQVDKASTRCVMVDAPTAVLPAQPGNLAAIGRLNGARLGVLASVLTPGRVSVGDAVMPA